MRFLARLRPDARQSVLAREVADLGGRIVLFIPALRIASVELPHAALLSDLTQATGVESVRAELAHEATWDYPPNDPYLASANALNRVNAPAAWSHAKGAGVLIAHLDSGVYVDHPDLAGNMSLPGYNARLDTTDVTPVTGHGTWTCGVLAATANNGIGACGIAPDAGVIPMVVMDGTGVAYESAVIAALLKAIERGARVASMSAAAMGTSQDEDAAIRLFEQAGGVFVVSALNADSDAGSAYPNHREKVVVSGVNNSNQVIYQRGDFLDIVAPASPGNFYTTNGANGYRSDAQGNSYAVPLVAGTIALIFSARPDLGPEDARQILYQSANDAANGSWSPGWDSQKGHGLLDAGAALAMAATWEPLGWQAPQAAITSPAPGDVIPAGVPTAVRVFLADDDPRLTLTLRINTVEVAVVEVTTDTHEFTHTFTQAGLNAIDVEVVDHAGNRVTSRSTVVRVIGTTNVGGTLTHTAQDLKQCESYAIRVRGRNSGGAGPWSEAESAALSCVAPTAPPYIDAVGYKLGAVKVGFVSARLATGHKYRIDSGAWVDALTANPITLPAAPVARTIEIVGYNGEGDSGIASAILEASPVMFIGDAEARGMAASIVASAVIAAQAGDAAAAGLPADVQHAVTIQATAGDAAAAGSPAAISQGITIAAGIGNAEASGLPASLSTGSAIEASPGDAQAAGLTAGISAATAIAATCGDAAAAGLPAGVSQGIVIVAGVGDASAAGRTANIAQAITITTTAGNAAAAGLTAAIDAAGGEIACLVGNAEARGLVAGIAAGVTVRASVGAALASWLPASVSTGAAIHAQVGAAMAAALQARIVAPVTIFCGHGDAEAAGLNCLIDTATHLVPTPGYTVARGARAWSVGDRARTWRIQ